MSIAISRTEQNPQQSTTILQMLCDESFERRSHGRDTDRLTVEEVVIDCSGVELISSEDLNALIRFHSRLRQESAAVVLVNVSEQIAQIFKLTRLNRLFEVQETTLPAC